MKSLSLSLFFIIITAGIITPAMGQGKPPVYASTYKTAKEYLEKKQFTMARALFIEVKRLAKRDGTYGAIIDYRIALCYEGEKNYTKATRHFKIYLGATIPKRWPSKASVRAKIKSYKAISATISPAVAIAASKKAILIKYAKAKRLLKRKAFYTAHSLFMEVRRVTLKLRIFEALIDYNIALCLFSMKRYKSSILYFRLYNRASFHNPGWPKRSLINNYIRQVQDVIKKSKQATTYDPNSAKYAKIKTLNNKGFKLFRQYNYKGAALSFIKVKYLEKRLKIYTHYIDYNIASCYDRLGKFRTAIRYYKTYLKAPIIKKSWPQIYSVRRRIADLNSELKRGNVFNSTTTNPPDNRNPPPNDGTPPPKTNTDPNNSYAGNETPTTSPGMSSYMSQWWFWPAVIGGVVVLAVVWSGMNSSSSVEKKSSNRDLLPGAMPSVGGTGGFNLFRF
jgi:tetratricopeptide (TPR) repeat protein